MSINYTNMLMEDLVITKRNETFELIESIEYEQAYINACIENNTIILEKMFKKNNKQPLLQRLRESFEKIFNIFMEKADKIIESLMLFKKSYLDVLDELSYDTISKNIHTISVYPHWDRTASIDVIEQQIKTMINKYNTEKNRNSDEFTADNSSIEYIINNVRPYTEYKSETEGYQLIMKKKFTTGTNIKNYTEKTISDPKEIKDVCIIARDYINSYKNVIQNFKALKNSLMRTLKDSTKDMKQSMNETYNPFLTLENAYLSETDLIFCRDGDIVTEISQSEDEKKQSSGTVEVTPTDNSEQSSSNNTQNKTETGNNTISGKDKYKMIYLNNLATINVKAVTTAMSVAEERLYLYRSIIKQVIIASRKKNKQSSETNDDKSNKQSKQQKETTSGKETTNGEKKGLFNKVFKSKKEK